MHKAVFNFVEYLIDFDKKTPSCTAQLSHDQEGEAGTLPCTTILTLLLCSDSSLPFLLHRHLHRPNPRRVEGGVLGEASSRSDGEGRQGEDCQVRGRILEEGIQAKVVL